MTRIFVAYSQNQATYAEQLRTVLETYGYTAWRAPGYPTPTSASYPAMIEQAILGSMAFILVWNNDAEQIVWVERQVLFAQDLCKPIFPILLDNTSLPNTLVTTTIVNGLDSSGEQVLIEDVIAALLALPGFPRVQSNDAFTQLLQQAAHPYIRERKGAIDLAAEMLKRDEQREAVLAILEYLARNDLMMGVREKAQEVLDADAKKLAPSPIHLDESRHMFGVRCKNGHVAYFDKRRVCSAYKEIHRDVKQSAGQELDELYLKCDQCGVEVIARVDCRGYK